MGSRAPRRRQGPSAGDRSTVVTAARQRRRRQPRPGRARPRTASSSRQHHRGGLVGGVLPRPNHPSVAWGRARSAAGAQSPAWLPVRRQGDGAAHLPNCARSARSARRFAPGACGCGQPGAGDLCRRRVPGGGECQTGGAPAGAKCSRPPAAPTPLLAADRPHAPLPVRQALRTLDRAVLDYINEAPTIGTPLGRRPWAE